MYTTLPQLKFKKISYSPKQLLKAWFLSSASISSQIHFTGLLPLTQQTRMKSSSNLQSLPLTIICNRVCICHSCPKVIHCLSWSHSPLRRCSIPSSSFNLHFPLASSYHDMTNFVFSLKSFLDRSHLKQNLTLQLSLSFLTSSASSYSISSVSYNQV